MAPMHTITKSNNRWSSLPVILAIGMTLFATVANVWMSVEHAKTGDTLLLAAAAIVGSGGGGSGGSDGGSIQHNDGASSETSSSMLEATQRLLETALVKANNTQTQMAAEIATSRLVVSKLQQELEKLKKGMTDYTSKQDEKKTSIRKKDSPVEETKYSPRSKKESIMIPQPTVVVEPHNQTIYTPNNVATVNKAISSSLVTTSTIVATKTIPSITETHQLQAETNDDDDAAMSAALGPVQAWSEGDNATGIRSRRLHNRMIYTNIANIPYIPFDNTTINPVLPSMKVNSATMLNIEIPLDYSITADMTSTIPWSNVSTVAFYQGKFYSGFRNQIMAFTVIVMETIQKGHGLLLLRSLRMKDTFGTNKLMEFAKLWDVAHWNSHYPRLPRLVHYDPILHSQFNYSQAFWHRTTSALLDGDTTSSTTTEKKWFGEHGLFASQSPTRPHSFGLQHQLSAAYMRYAIKGRGPYAAKTAKKTDPSSNTGSVVAVGFRNPIEILMLQGAMRPHPNFQAIIERLLAESGLEKGSDSNGYMTLHARVEPDMQKHPVCRDKKVLNLTDIFDFIEQKWPEPPVSRIFMPINRQYMEQEGYVNKHDQSKTNWIAVQNLKALNHARDYGLWNGTVKVLEFGANALDNTTYANRPSTGGAMLNFFIGIGAKIFIGTEVSSYSHDLLATRFYRNAIENYHYLPDGLHEWTPPGTVDPPGFSC